MFGRAEEQSTVDHVEAWSIKPFMAVSPGSSEAFAAAVDAGDDDHLATEEERVVIHL